MLLHRLLLLFLPCLCLYPRPSLAVLDEAFVKLSLEAIKLCQAVQNEDLTNFAGATLYKDGTDAAVFYESNNYCFVAFDSTTRSDLRDWWKSLELEVDEVCPLDGGDCCQARNGHEGAYNIPSYRVELDQKVINCYNNGQKEVVLTGHSLGGSISTVAAVGLTGSVGVPILITFGQLASIVGGCPSIDDNDKYYRFVNTHVNHGGVNLDYDPVPSLDFNAQHRGRLLVMGDDTENLVTYSNGQSPSIRKWGFAYKTHELLSYLARIESYQDKGSLGTDGWATGFRCNLDEECRSKSCGGWSWYWSSGKCK